MVQLGVQIGLFQNLSGLLLKKSDLLGYHGQLTASTCSGKLRMEAMKHNNISSFVGMYITQKVYTPEWNRMEHQAMLTAISKARK